MLQALFYVVGFVLICVVTAAATDLLRRVIVRNRSALLLLVGAPALLGFLVALSQWKSQPLWILLVLPVVAVLGALALVALALVGLMPGEVLSIIGQWVTAIHRRLWNTDRR